MNKWILWSAPPLVVILITAGFTYESARMADPEAFKVTSLDAPSGIAKSRFRITGEEDPADAIFENVDVGIGVAAPAEKLDVGGAVKIGNTTGSNDGTVRYTGTDLEGRVGGEWKSLTQQGGGGGGTGHSINYPDGAFGQTVKRVATWGGNPYTVTTGKIFWVTAIYNDSTATQTVEIPENDLDNFAIGAKNTIEFESPLPIAAGTVISGGSSSSAPMVWYGVEVTQGADTTARRIEVWGGNEHTVPSDADFFVIGVYNDSTATQVAEIPDGNLDNWAVGAKSFRQFPTPIPIARGTVIGGGSSSSAPMVWYGYERK